MKLVRIYNALFAFIILTSSGFGQWSLQTGLNGKYDDNINNNYLQMKDKITSLSLTGLYTWETDNSATEMFYSGSLNYYNTTIDRTFHYHSIGIDYNHLYGEEQETHLNLGASYNTRINRNDYTLYDHAQISAFGTLKFPVGERFAGMTGYSFTYLDMKEVPDFNYIEHAAFFQLKSYLPTRTTIILQTDLGYKMYTTPNIDTSYTAGTGRWGEKNSSSTSSYPGVTQLIGMMRIGQAIVDGTGLSLSGHYILNLQSESRYILSYDGIVSGDDIFDDQYSYEGPSANITLTQLLPAQVVLKMTAGLQNRNYLLRPAYDLLGNEITDKRIDTRKNIFLSAEKNFEELGFSLGLSYEYLLNSSNDEYFNYNNNILGISLRYEYYSS
ncbi:MAG: hypothetical protein QME52_14375 [Bacteroidota bacterium]|nr:hypothetical protein [Bacteroidota bacterium]